MRVLRCHWLRNGRGSFDMLNPWCVRGAWNGADVMG
jgi:hypothetical protein